MSESTGDEEPTVSPASDDGELAPGVSFTWFDSEYFLLVPVIVISGLYTAAARTYPWDARVFPQASAAVVFVLALGVLARKLDSASAAKAREGAARVRATLSADGARAGLTHWRDAASIIWETNAGYTVVTTFVFLLLTPWIGLIITAPVFTFVYLRRFDFSTAFGVMLSLVVLGYVYAVMVALNLSRYLGGILY